MTSCAAMPGLHETITLQRGFMQRRRLVAATASPRVTPPLGHRGYIFGRRGYIMRWVSVSYLVGKLFLACWIYGCNRTYIDCWMTPNVDSGRVDIFILPIDDKLMELITYWVYNPR